MARESPAAETDRFTDGASDDARDGRLHRRSYMRLAGAAAAGTALTTAATASEDGADYDVVEATGQVIRVGAGETLENTLIDLTTGGSVVILVEGGDAVVRNVGFEGLYRGDEFVISIAASSGDVLFENVYVGDGATKEGSNHAHGPGAVFYQNGAGCDVTFRNCNVQGYPNNGFYCSNTASGGSVRFESCFGKNNGVATFRCAGGNDAIENCVAYNDDTDYGPGYGGFSETSGRPVWVWNGGEVTIRDSEFAAGPYPTPMVAGANGAPGTATVEGGAISGGVQRDHGSTVTVADDVSSDPALEVPDGVPTSAAEAAAGSVASRPSTDEAAPERVLRVEGTDEDATRYEVAVDGRFEAANARGESLGDDLGDVVQGVVADWTDTVLFAGDLEGVALDGPGTVTVDGEAVDPDDYGEAHPHVLEVEGQGAPASFELTVDGSVELADDADGVTTVSGSTVQGSVTDSSVAVRFSGALTDVTFTEGEATLSLDGEAIEPDDVDDRELPPHVLVVDGTDADDASSYSVTVDGPVVETDHRPRPTGLEALDAETVEGEVENSLEAYWFDGRITDFSLAGGASVTVQFNVRNQ